jgi:hypothetical protein
VLYPLSYEGGGSTKDSEYVRESLVARQAGYPTPPAQPEPDDLVPDAGYRCSRPWTVRPEIMCSWRNHTPACPAARHDEAHERLRPAA